MTKVLGIFLMFLALYAVLLVSNPDAASVASQQNLGLRVGTLGILVLAVAPVIIAGGIDLSIGSVLVLNAVCFVLLMKYGLALPPYPQEAALLQVPPLPPYPAAALVLLGAACIGLIHGLLITKLRLQPFLATLCGLFIARGLARWIPREVTQSTGTVPVSGTPHDLSSIDFLVTDLFPGLPWPWVWGILVLGLVLAVLSVLWRGLKGDRKALLLWIGLGCVAVAAVNGLIGWSGVGVPWALVLMTGIATVLGVVLHATVYGRYLYAIGANEQAARYAGIATDRYKILTYVWCSMLVAVGGILFILENGGANPANDGSFYELYAITGAVLGGCSLRGGDGTIIGILLGAAILPLLRNIILFAGVPDDVEFAVVGLALLLGTVADETLKRRAGGRV